MWSISSGAMFCSAATPSVPGLMRTPSTSTSVWFEFAPRMNAVVVWPGPPTWAMSMPAWKRSRSPTSGASERSISARSITMTGASDSKAVSASRLAVTTTRSKAGLAASSPASPESPAGVAAAAHSGVADSTDRTDRDRKRDARLCMDGSPPCSPAWICLECPCAEETDRCPERDPARLHPPCSGTDRQAGLRTPESTSLAGMPGSVVFPRPPGFPAFAVTAARGAADGSSTRLPLRGQRRNGAVQGTTASPTSRFTPWRANAAGSPDGRHREERLHRCQAIDRPAGGSANWRAWTRATT